MRKIFAIALAACIGAVGLCAAACNEPEKPSENFEFSLDDILASFPAEAYEYGGEPCTVTMAHWDSAGPMEETTTRLVIEGFERRYPDIHVELDIISNYADNYAKTIASGKLHDVFMVSDGEFRLWSEGGKMQDLAPFLDTSTLLTPELLANDMLPGALERYKNDSDALLCFPKDIGPHVLYYNKDIFDRLGVEYPPEDRIMTIDEATEMWKKLTVKEGDRISVYGLGAFTGEGLVWSAGGDYLNADRTSFPTEQSDIDALKRAYGYLQNAVVVDKFIPDGAVSGGLSGLDMFCAQKAATVVAGRWDVSTLRTMDFNWDIAYVPAFEGEDMEKNYWSGSVGYAMFNECKHKEAAWKLIEYFGSPEGQTILAASGFSIPVYTSVAYNEAVVQREKSLGPQNYDVFIESAKHQPAGTHTYTASQRWLKEGYNASLGNLFALNENSRWSVDRFIDEVRARVNEFI